MIQYNPIGVVHSPFRNPVGTPIQAVAGAEFEAEIEIFTEFQEGLTGIEGFSHLILLYHLHRIQKAELLVKPFLGEEIHGIFSTRSPGRPNPIGFSVVQLVKVDGGRLWIRDVDILDQTPVLDIKPYVGEFDIRPVDRIGWFAANLYKLPTVKDDGRFSR